MTMSNIELIKEWIESRPTEYFPPTFDTSMIERFLYVCENNIERCQEVIQLFFKLRTEYTDYFTNRDPFGTNIQNAFKVTNPFPLPKKTPEGYQVYMTRLEDTNPSKFEFADYVKLFFAICDVRMKLETKIPTGDIPIFDMAGFSFKHLMKLMLSMSHIKRYLKITQEAHPVYLKQIHVINTGPLLDKILLLVKPFMKEEVKKTLHFHTQGSDTLFDYIPRDIVPVEFGGKAAISMLEIKEQWKKRVEDEREWLMTNPWRNNSNDEPVPKEDIYGNKDSSNNFESISFD